MGHAVVDCSCWYLLIICKSWKLFIFPAAYSSNCPHLSFYFPSSSSFSYLSLLPSSPPNHVSTALFLCEVIISWSQMLNDRQTDWYEHKYTDLRSLQARPLIVKCPKRWRQRIRQTHGQKGELARWLVGRLSSRRADEEAADIRKRDIWDTELIHVTLSNSQ